MAKRNSFERLQAPGERTPLSQRWPVILLALLLVWPLGLTLLLLKLLKAARGGRVDETRKKSAKVPYASCKSREKSASYLEKHKHQKKMNLSSAIMTALLLGLGCYGLTRVYLYLFAVRRLTWDLVQNFLWQCVFLLAGAFLAYRIYVMFQRQYAAGRILTKLNGRAAVPLEQLAQSLSCEPTDLYDTILWMISMDYFGDGAELDTEKKMLYCTRRPDESA